MYILVRINDGKAVTIRGNKDSYTRDIRKMRRYPTIEDAETDRCVENECIVEFSKLIHF